MIVPVVLTLASGIPLELDAYLKSPNPAKSWKVESKKGRHTEAAFTSQEWQGKKWVHDLLITQPSGPLGGGQAILYITGDRVDRADLPFIERLADQARMPVVTLFDVPNQPLWGKKEDDLIAHTFEQYLKTGDATWPLLFPMAKAALSAMDAAQAIGGYKKFVVTGGSKRGWTTWMAGISGDSRIKGIAPMVYDNLNIRAQISHQEKYYGKLSEMIRDYTERGLIAIMDTEPGKKLTAMVDPYTYLSHLKCPVLAVTGSNDRYWTVDSQTLYWNDIKTPKFLSIVPNAGHNLGDGKQATAAIAFFARGCLGTISGGLPAIKSWTAYQTGDKRQTSSGVWAAATWSALDFRGSTWFKNGLGSTGSPPTGYAEYHSVTLKSDGLSADFCSPVKVTRRLN